jgi:hypothetical protein
MLSMLRLAKGQTGWRGLCLSVLLWHSLDACAAGNVIQHVDDIDAWRMELAVGASNSGGVMQGSLLEISNGHSLCFMPSGECFMVQEGAVLSISKERVARCFAGTPGLEGYLDGPVEHALLGRQLSICPDTKGGLLLCDRSNRCLRRIFKKEDKWVVATLAGDPSKKEWDRKPVDGTGKEALFKYLHSNVICDEAGNACLMDNNFLRRVTPEGGVETLNPDGGSGAPGKESEPLAAAKFNLIMGGGICFGGDQCVYVADRWNHCLRRIDLKEKTVAVVAGPGTGYRDGPEKNCGFHDSPGHIVYDPWRKRFYTNGVDDHGLRVWENGAVKTIAGGINGAKGLDGPAKTGAMMWCYVSAVDPLPPHDIYFGSGGNIWQRRLGKLTQAPATAEKSGEAKP